MTRNAGKRACTACTTLRTFAMAIPTLFSATNKLLRDSWTLHRARKAQQRAIFLLVQEIACLLETEHHRLAATATLMKDHCAKRMCTKDTMSTLFEMILGHDKHNLCAIKHGQICLHINNSTGTFVLVLRLATTLLHNTARRPAVYICNPANNAMLILFMVMRKPCWWAQPLPWLRVFSYTPRCLPTRSSICDKAFLANCTS